MREYYYVRVRVRARSAAHARLLAMREESHGGPCPVADTSLRALAAEIEAARAKFPGNRFLLTALVEEVGELAKALLQNQHPEEIEREALQVACVAIRIIEEGDATFATLRQEETKP